MGHIENALGQKFVIIRELFEIRAHATRSKTHLILVRLNVSLQKWVNIEHDELVHADDPTHDENDEHFCVVRHVPDLKLGKQ